MRDFAVDTLSKNGGYKILKDPEINCELRDFAADTLLKHGTDVQNRDLADIHLKNGSFSIKGFFCLFP